MAIERKNQKDMTAAERQAYQEAVQHLDDSGDLGKLVAIHGDMKHRMHGAMEGMTDPVGEQRFLPWHREFLLQFEAQLRKLDAKLYVPYWDWTIDRTIPAWMKSFRPTIGMPDKTEITVARYSEKNGAKLPTTRAIAATLRETDYTTFTEELENHHNMVHVWVGGVRRDATNRIERVGTMNDIGISPADPLFWLHHGQIDRIWDKWMTEGNKGKPSLANGTDKLDPWRSTASSLAVPASTLGGRAYSYR